MDLTGPLQIGGLPSIPSSFQVKSKDFIGCVADLYIDHKFIDLNRYGTLILIIINYFYHCKTKYVFLFSFVVDNGTVAGCPEKRSHCGSNPCHNFAECRDIWDTYLCECTEGYTGKDCSECMLNLSYYCFNPLK